MRHVFVISGVSETNKRLTAEVLQELVEDPVIVICDHVDAMFNQQREDRQQVYSIYVYNQDCSRAEYFDWLVHANSASTKASIRTQLRNYIQPIVEYTRLANYVKVVHLFAMLLGSVFTLYVVLTMIIQ